MILMFHILLFMVIDYVDMSPSAGLVTHGIEAKKVPSAGWVHQSIQALLGGLEGKAGAIRFAHQHGIALIVVIANAIILLDNEEGQGIGHSLWDVPHGLGEVTQPPLEVGCSNLGIAPDLHGGGGFVNAM